MKDNFDIINELFTELKDLKPLKAEDNTRLKKKFRLEFNYNSNHIEGNTLTYGETELLLIFDDTTGNHHMREYEEIKAHDVAYQFVEELSNDNDRPLTEQIIKNLNEIILVRPYWKDALTADGQKTRRLIDIGDHKKQPNSVRLANGEIFEYASPVDTPILMRELVQWLKDEVSAVPPVTLAAILHYKFVRIHPFDDGNGRISRLLMNYILLKNGYPPVIIKSNDKENYLRVLHIADFGDYEPLISYVSELAISSLKVAIKAAKGQSLEDADDFIKEIELLKRKSNSHNTPKSPMVVYDTFKTIKNKVWLQLINTLEHFDSLFNESRDSAMLNSYPEKKEIKKFRGTMDDIIGATLSKEFDDPKIFGFNIYETEIRSITWTHKMFALKNAEVPIDIEISLSGKFDNDSYSLNLSLDSITIHKVKKKYLELFLDSDIEAIGGVLKKSLLQHISSRIN